MAEMKWTREPLDYRIEPDRIEITTTPHTDLWQRTYGFSDMKDEMELIL